MKKALIRLCANAGAELRRLVPPATLSLTLALGAPRAHPVRASTSFAPHPFSLLRRPSALPAHVAAFARLPVALAPAAAHSELVRPSLAELAFGTTAARETFGASGAVYLRTLTVDDVPNDVAPGVYSVTAPGHAGTVAVLTPFSSKVGSRVHGYQVGYWPAERRWVASAAYANPLGFIEVTQQNQDTPVSAHFKLRDFLTYDGQPNIWPKELVLREPLLDKLELVLQDLEQHGIPTNHVVILSGFRTPAHNLALGDASGRSRESRHQFGDAADIIIDADGDGRMDDLNGDGRVNAADVRVIEDAVNRVERAHPELKGGLGLYDAQGPHGPFAHIDVRGRTARWERFGHFHAWSRRFASTQELQRFAGGRRVDRDIDGRFMVHSGSGQCSAPPRFAMLCRSR